MLKASMGVITCRSYDVATKRLPVNPLFQRGPGHVVGNGDGGPNVPNHTNWRAVRHGKA